MQGFIWGTSGNAIIKYDPKADTCATFLDQVGQMFTFLGKDSIVYMTYDRSGELLARLYHVRDSRDEDLMLKNKPLTIKGFVNGLHYSNSGILWAAASTGLYKIDLARETMEVLGLEEPFLDSRFMCMEEDRKGRLWLGTPLGGLHIYDPATRALKILNSDNGLANNTVASIVEDDDGDFWLGTYNGVSVVSPEGELIGNLYVEDGLVHHEANRFASLKTSDGKLLIGTISGLNVIDPGTLKKRLREPKNLKIYLTRIRYFDDRTQTDADLLYGLNQAGTIYLPAGKRNLRLNFAVSNYFNPEANQYAYMLEGKNEEWVSIGNQHSLNLNDLPAGKYRLLIKGGDDIGNWTAEPLAISIDAGEFFYKQIWFYLLCILLTIGLGALWIYRLRTEIRKATQTIRKDKDLIEGQARQLQELDIAKSRFFTNITHEFRTPLTIISGMAGQIMDNPKAWGKKGGEMIKQNSANLLNLVNQILDLRKMEAKELKLNMVQGDVVQYLRYLSQSYEIYARGKGLQLHFLPAIDKLAMDFDPEKLLRILSNLLSNAVKYTPDGGNVYLHVNQSVKNGNPFLSLRVEDTGRGIAEADLPHIFDRFYQVDASTTRKGEGTGIGLALTQELVNLMNGNIEVKSTPGKGTSFTLWLPITTDSPVMEVLSQDVGQVSSLMVDSPAVQQTKQDDWRTGERLTDGLPSLLIVEDNPDIRQFLVACLEERYQLQTAANGQEGIDLALEQVPDLIISDVMMPEKDGFELCEILKNDERTSHIPIILLTAKADMESKISGLRKGADAYLTKPFEQEELMVRLDKLFELRKKLQARYSSLGPETAPENKEDEFVQKVRQSVLENISDETYGIAQLCRAVALSRAQLHNKLKALTGQSTSHFVRSIRLHKAKELLESSDLNISEVGYEVGFKNPAHFSSAYFDQFGLPPSKTRK
jgi:signal transduction histidine kinase/CheY-like chemotaxis protein/AraC-like DNA-binding protein